MLNWASRFNIFCFLDNQQYTIQPNQYEYLLGVGVRDSIESDNIKELDDFLRRHHHWVFGHLSYDLKDAIHFSSGKQNKIGFPGIYFFVPEFIFFCKNGKHFILAENSDALYETILNESLIPSKEMPSLHIQQGLAREGYLEKIKSLQAHILRGDCYEINFCQEFFSEAAVIDPLNVFEKLMTISPNPFSAFYKLTDKFLLCASPERFLLRQGNDIVSQPIKGTIRRNANNESEDRDLRDELRESAKDQSENVMVVDLVRNDFSKICVADSVHVEELFGVYSYPQVHQMISTVRGQLKEKKKFSEILEATFPMGSMTGAPKYRVMELIDAYEVQSRGIFSGSVGYISPEGDFDFNVVIRSIMYNSTRQYLSYQVGSGITFYSNPEKEWEECLLKGEAIKKVLAN